MKKFTIGIIGAGTVGRSLIQMIKEQKSIIYDKFDLELNIQSIATRTPSKINGEVSCPVFSDWRQVTEDPEIQLVVELIGGTSTAMEIAESTLINKKTLITANKALISEKGSSLFQISKKQGVEIGYEASVAGAIPIIRTLRDSLSPNQFSSITGILNGTTNFILTKMELEKLSYEEALQIAQNLGFAESDPSFDVAGTDVAHKIAILARLAFAKYISIENIYTRGITEISSEDIQNAINMGYRIKLLGRARDSNGRILATVQPVLISINHPLANVMHENNGIFYQTNYAGSGMLSGSGAGGNPTASAVLADILYYSKRRDFVLANPSLVENNTYPGSLFDSPSEEESRFYIRFTTVDKPGVLSCISHILGKNNISISSVNQNESIENEKATVLITTHSAISELLNKSIQEIDKNKDIIREPTVAFPIVEKL